MRILCHVDAMNEFAPISRSALCRSSVFAAAAALLALLPGAGAEIEEEPARNVRLHLSATGAYDSNIFANANEQDDFYLLVTPSLEYLRQTGLLNLGATAGVDLFRFADFTEQDTEDLFAALNLSYPNRPGFNPTQFTFDLGWRERSTADEGLGRRIEAELFNVDLGARRTVSDKLALRGNGGFGQADYRQRDLSTIDTWLLAGDLVYTYSDKLDVFSGYRYRNTRTDGASRQNLDMTDHLLRIGAEGQLLPRVSGVLAGGVQNRRFAGGDRGSAVRPNLDASLTWVPRERSRGTLSVQKDFQTSADDRSVEITSFGASWNQVVYQGLAIEPRLGYSHVRFSGPAATSRSDDAYTGGIGLLYDFAGNASTGLRYSYTNRESNDLFFDYERHLVELFGRVTF
jgi:hypothetical protein